MTGLSLKGGPGEPTTGGEFELLLEVHSLSDSSDELESESEVVNVANANENTISQHFSLSIFSRNRASILR